MKKLILLLITFLLVFHQPVKAEQIAIIEDTTGDVVYSLITNSTTTEYVIAQEKNIDIVNISAIIEENLLYIRLYVRGQIESLPEVKYVINSTINSNSWSFEYINGDVKSSFKESGEDATYLSPKFTTNGTYLEFRVVVNESLISDSPPVTLSAYVIRSLQNSESYWSDYAPNRTTEEQSTGDSQILIIGVVIAIVVAAIIVYYYFRNIRIPKKPKK